MEVRIPQLYPLITPTVLDCTVMIPVEMILTTTTNHQPAMIFMDYIFTLEGYRNINRSILMLVVLVVGSDVGFRRITEVQFVLQNTGHFASEGIFLWCPQEIVRVAFCIGICSEFEHIAKKKLKSPKCCVAHF